MAKVRTNIWTSIPWRAFALLAAGTPACAVLVLHTLGDGLGVPSVAAAAPSASASARDDSTESARAAAESIATLVSQRSGAQPSELAQQYERLLQGGFGPSPLRVPLRAREHASSMGGEGGAGSGADEVRISPPPEVQVTSIFAFQAGMYAIVADRAVRVGDSVAEVWEVVEINPTEQSVTLRHVTGVTYKLELRKPDQGQAPAPQRGGRRR